jgi:hypothetical protein
MGQYRNYTDDDFIVAWSSSTSIRQVLGKLGLREAGGNYHCAKERAKSLGLTKDHMLGQAHNSYAPIATLKQILIAARISSSTRIPLNKSVGGVPYGISY